MALQTLSMLCARIQKLQNADTKVISSFVDCTISSARLSPINNLIASPNEKVSNQAISTIKHLIDLKKFVAETPSLAIKLKCLSIENLPHIIPCIERWIKKDTFFENQTLIHDMTQVISDLVYSSLNQNYSDNINCHHVTKVFTIVCGILGRYNIYNRIRQKSKTSHNDDNENNRITHHSGLKIVSVKAWFAIAHIWEIRKDINIPSEYVIHVYLYC